MPLERLCVDADAASDQQSGGSEVAIRGRVVQRRPSIRVAMLQVGLEVQQRAQHSLVSSQRCHEDGRLALAVGQVNDRT